jgi:DNA-binding NtrC family response regulator
MPQMDGLKLLQEIKSESPETNVLVITAHATLDSAIGAIRFGASDYLVKPFKISELLEAVRKALSEKRLIPETVAKSQVFQARYHIKNLIGATDEMREIHRLVEKVAKTSSNVLIIGESGTGKEMVARTIHYHSKSSNGPFVSINCAALPENLLESELFGYEKGAFTGAVSSKAGLFELAENGTFLLDEVGDMPVNLQVKLLRVLQERILRRLGGIKDIPVNFRLIAATSKNLPDEIRGGRFREELFYRLNVIPILLPPLRSRKDDIKNFVKHAIEIFIKKHGLNRELKVTKEAMTVFEMHAWPGNIRELENVVERLVALVDGNEINKEMAEESIQKGSFSSGNSQPIKETSNLHETVEIYERDLISKALKESKGNKNKAAKKLNLTRQALHYKLKKYGIEKDESE